MVRVTQLGLGRDGPAVISQVCLRVRAGGRHWFIIYRWLESWQAFGLEEHVAI